MAGKDYRAIRSTSTQHVYKPGECVRGMCVCVCLHMELSDLVLPGMCTHCRDRVSKETGKMAVAPFDSRSCDLFR